MLGQSRLGGEVVELVSAVILETLNRSPLTCEAFSLHLRLQSRTRTPHAVKFSPLTHPQAISAAPKTRKTDDLVQMAIHGLRG